MLIKMVGIISMGLGIGAATLRAGAVAEASVVVLEPEDVLVPGHFVEGDQVQAVLYSRHLDPCRVIGPALSRVGVGGRLVFIRSTGIILPHCRAEKGEARAPQFQLVDLGPLPSGRYSILVEQLDNSFRNMAEVWVASGPR